MTITPSSQGIGFVMGGKVLYKSTLWASVVAVFTTLGALGPIYAAFSSTPVGGGDLPCGLSVIQTATIKSAMLNANTSCPYDMTLHQVITGGKCTPAPDNPEVNCAVFKPGGRLAGACNTGFLNTSSATVRKLCATTCGYCT